MSQAMDTELKHWEEWKEKCDLKVCCEDTQAALLKYIEKRAGHLVSRNAAAQKRAPGNYHEISGWEWWHIVESFYHIPDKRGRMKPYKDWLFARIRGSSRNSPAYVAEAMAEKYLLHSAIRNWLVEQCPSIKNTMFLDAPLSTDDNDGTTVRDKTPDPNCQTADEPARRECKRLAGEFAARFFTAMSLRERVVLATLALELPASCPEAEAAAECKKSMLHVAHHTVRDRLKQEMAEEAEDCRFYVEQALLDLCVDWANGEKSCEPIFHLLAKRQAEGGRL